MDMRGPENPRSFCIMGRWDTLYRIYTIIIEQSV